MTSDGKIPTDLVATVRHYHAPDRTDLCRVTIGETYVAEAIPVAIAMRLTDAWNVALADLVTTGTLARCQAQPGCSMVATEALTDLAGETMPACRYHAREALRYVRGVVARPLDPIAR